MGLTVAKQPNGKYCVFNRQIEDIIAYDCDKFDLACIFSEHNERSLASIVKNQIAMADNEVMYSRILDTIEFRHGKEKAEHLDKRMSEMDD